MKISAYKMGKGFGSIVRDIKTTGKVLARDIKGEYKRIKPTKTIKKKKKKKSKYITN